MRTRLLLCTFRVADLFLALPVQDVQEVLRYRVGTPVPRSDRVVRGLTNLRGQIIAAVDLRRRLGLPDHDGQLEQMQVVVRTADGATALIVDEIGDVIETDGHMDPPPKTLPRQLLAVASGIQKFTEGLLVVLFAERVVSALERDRA